MSAVPSSIIQQELRREEDSYYSLLRDLTAIQGGLNSDRDRQDAERLQREISEASNFLSGFAARNLAANELFYAKIQGQYKGRPTSVSDLSKQLDHLENMGYYARPTRFCFYIDGLKPEINDRLIRNCISTSLPGRALMTQGFKIYGNPLEQVYEVNYATEMNMTFRVGEDMLERDMFESWMNKSISYNTADVAYPDDYMTTMRIYQLDRKDGYLYCIRLNNVFCKTIADMDFSSDSSDQVQTVQVTIAYSDFAVVGRTDVQNLQQSQSAESQDKFVPPRSRATRRNVGRNNLAAILNQRENERNNRDRQTQVESSLWWNKIGFGIRE